MEKVALALVLGLAAGVLAGLFGVGADPLRADADACARPRPAARSGDVARAMLPVVAVGTWNQRRYGHVRLRPALCSGWRVSPVCSRGFLAESLPEHVLERLFGVLLLCVAAQLAWRASRHRT